MGGGGVCWGGGGGGVCWLFGVVIWFPQLLQNLSDGFACVPQLLQNGIIFHPD
jgi:hypothetical protein